jgi:hypothetical protein
MSHVDIPLLKRKQDSRLEFIKVVVWELRDFSKIRVL